MYFADQPIIHDFDQFIGYLEVTAPLSLTKSMKRLQAADLLVLNGKMSPPVVLNKNRPTQQDFLLLNVFFYTGLAAELFSIRQGRKGQLLHIQSERIALYHAMNADERYGFLLQSFWCYLDWDLAFDRRPPFEIGRLSEIMEEESAQKKFSFASSGRPMMTSKVLAEVLRAFGLFEYTLSTNANWHNNTYIGIETLTLTQHGQKILPPLFQERPIYIWGNLDPYMTRARIERIYGPLDPKDELPLELMDFFAAFKPAFPDWTITNRLFPITQALISGELTLKVLLAPKCYRVILISTASTLDDLHLAIQKVFDFDNDHLYAFFLNGVNKYKAGNVYFDPRVQMEAPDYPAHLISLGEIGLYPGKELLYLFDFGDNWRFIIQVLAIENTSEIDSSDIFKLIESRGKAPEQYSGWEE